MRRDGERRQVCERSELDLGQSLLGRSVAATPVAIAMAAGASTKPAVAVWVAARIAPLSAAPLALPTKNAVATHANDSAAVPGGATLSTNTNTAVRNAGNARPAIAMRNSMVVGTA